MMKIVKRYLKIWWLMSRNSFMSVLGQKLSLSIFLTGKILRFIFFLAFMVFLLGGTKSLAGYDLNQTVVFFMSFMLIDVISQFLFREVYRFRPLVVSGDFDLVLVKPVSALFRSLAGGADVIDLITIPPLLILTYIAGSALQPSFIQAAIFILLILNGLLIACAFHIAVLALGIITLEIDHTIMVYRDLVSLGRFPIDIYKQPLKAVLTYLIPVGIMIAFPAKELIGVVSTVGVVVSFGVGIAAIFVAVKFWNYALRFYTSASS